MKTSARKDLAFVLPLAAGLVGAVAVFLASSVSWWIVVSLSGLAVVLLLAGGFAMPPFWWGNHHFTTAVSGPSHEAKREQDT